MIQQHSLFYTLGLCVIMQGTFSIISHFCPSNISLQFDTTMMYMMMIPVFVKTYQTYQFRHPDTCACAYNAMYSFFLLLSLEAVSLYIERRELHHFIFYGAIKISYTATVPVLCSYISLPLSWPKIPNLLIGLYLLLISFALYFGTSSSPGAPKYLPLVSHATLSGEDKSSVIVVMSVPNLPFIIIAVSIVTTAILNVSTFIYYHSELQVQPHHSPPSSLKISPKPSLVVASFLIMGTLYNLTLQLAYADISNSAGPSCILEHKTDGAVMISNLTNTFRKLKSKLPDSILHCKEVKNKFSANLSRLEMKHKFSANMVVPTITQELCKNANFRKVSLSALKDLPLCFLSAKNAVVLLVK